MGRRRDRRARLAFLERSLCLPVLFRLWRPRRNHIPQRKSDPERPTKPEMAREMLDLLAARLGERDIDIVGDGAYASRVWRGLPKRVSVTSRLRDDAAIYDRPRPGPARRADPRSGESGLGAWQR